MPESADEVDLSDEGYIYRIEIQQNKIVFNHSDEAFKGLAVLKDNDKFVCVAETMQSTAVVFDVMQMKTSGQYVNEGLPLDGEIDLMTSFAGLGVIKLDEYQHNRQVCYDRLIGQEAVVRFLFRHSRESVTHLITNDFIGNERDFQQFLDNYEGEPKIVVTRFGIVLFESQLPNLKNQFYQYL